MTGLINFVKGAIRIVWTLQWMELLQTYRYKASIDRYSEIGYDDIIGYASKAAQVPASSMYMAMDAIFDAMNYFVTEGHSVELPYIGTFSFGINGKVAWTAEDAKTLASKVYRKKIRFLMSKELRQMIRNVNFTSIINDNGITPGDDPQAISCMLLPLGAGETEGNRNFQIRVEGANLSEVSGTAITYDAEGNETPAAFTLTSSDGRNWRAKLDNYYGIKSIELAKNGVGFYSKEFGKYAGDFVDTVYSVTENIQLSATTSLHVGSQTLRITGNNVDKFELKMDGVTVPFTQTSSTQCTAVINLEDDCILTIADKTFNIVAIAQPQEQPLVQSLKANNVSVANGGSSTIIVGNNYHFIATGQHLDLVTPDQITGPGNVTNFTKSASQIEFDFVPSGAGTLKVTNNFTVNLTVAAASLPVIATVGGVSNNGTKNIYSGDSLAVVMTSGDFAGVTVSASQDTITVEKSGNNIVVTNMDFGTYPTVQIFFRSDDTTIFTLNVSFDERE